MLVYESQMCPIWLFRFLTDRRFCKRIRKLFRTNTKNSDLEKVLLLGLI